MAIPGLTYGTAYACAVRAFSPHAFCYRGSTLPDVTRVRRTRAFTTRCALRDHLALPSPAVYTDAPAFARAHSALPGLFTVVLRPA